jgi:hypothetical protein
MYALKLFLQAVGCRFLFRAFVKNLFQDVGQRKVKYQVKGAPKWDKFPNAKMCITMGKNLE